MSLTLEQALVEALNDEYKARATYAQIIRKFGEVRPFANIVHAENRHVHALLPLFHKYGIPVPEDTWPQRVVTPSSLLEASRAGVQAEIENAAMYRRLLAATGDYADVQQVLLNLQRASQENHLPAFQRSVQRLEGRRTTTAPAPVTTVDRQTPYATGGSPTAASGHLGGAGHGGARGGAPHAGGGCRGGGFRHGWGGGKRW